MVLPFSSGYQRIVRYATSKPAPMRQSVLVLHDVVELGTFA
jgi:hypothetical protein